MEKYSRKKMDVAIFSQERPNMRVMRGKALLDDEANDLKFVENEPRGPRSVEVGRTMHSRFVRRPDGNYTVTIRCDGRNKYLREELTSEIISIVNIIKEDLKKQQRNGEEKLKGKSEPTEGAGQGEGKGADAQDD